MSEQMDSIVTVGDEDVDVTVTYTYYRASRGMRDSLGGIRGAGPALEPDEPAHAELLDVFDAAGVSIINRLDQHTIEKLEEAAYWHHVERGD